MDVMVAATYDNIMMVEGEMKEVSEQDLLAALKAAHEAIKPMCQLQKELAKELGTDVKREYCHEVNDEELREQTFLFRKRLAAGETLDDLLEEEASPERTTAAQRMRGAERALDAVRGKFGTNSARLGL
mgnify:CR=1 FL=1